VHLKATASVQYTLEFDHLGFWSDNFQTLPETKIHVADVCSCAVTLSPSLGADPLGCIIPYNSRKGMERKQSNNLSTYAIVPTHKSHNRSVPLRATFQRILRTGKLHLHLTYLRRWYKTRADAICTGPRSKEVKKREERRRNIQSNTVLHISTSGMSGIRPSNLVLVTRTKYRSLSKLDTIISVKSPIIV
jgi:hypothetical protein